MVSGPSGVGKTTVVSRLLADPTLDRAVTATTRSPRPGEVDGEDYVFLSRSEFERRVAQDGFLEHAVVHGELYGTPRQSVEAVLDAGGVCLLNIDVQGAAAIRGKVEPALFLFLKPPDLDELARRLERRGTEGAGAVERRLEVARSELAREGEYDDTVVNDDLDRAVKEIRDRIAKELGRIEEASKR